MLCARKTGSAGMEWVRWGVRYRVCMTTADMSDHRCQLAVGKANRTELYRMGAGLTRQGQGQTQIEREEERQSESESYSY